MNKPKKEKKTKTTRTCKINIINMKNQGYSSPEYFASLEKIFIHPEFSRLCRKYFLACKLQNNGPLIRQWKITDYYTFLLHGIFSDTQKFQDFLGFLREEMLVNNKWETIRNKYTKEELEFLLHSLMEMHYKLEGDNMELGVSNRITYFREVMQIKIWEVISSAVENFPQAWWNNQCKMLRHTMENGIFPINNFWDISGYIGKWNIWSITYSFISWEIVEVDRFWNNVFPWTQILDIECSNSPREEIIERKNQLERFLEITRAMLWNSWEEIIIEWEEFEDLCYLRDIWLWDQEDYRDNAQDPLLREKQKFGKRFITFLEESIQSFERKASRATLELIQ